MLSFPLSYGIHIVIQAGRHLRSSLVQSLHGQLWGQALHCSGLLSCLVLKTLRIESAQPLHNLFHSLTILSSSLTQAGNALVSACVCCLSSSLHAPLWTDPIFAITFSQYWKAAIRSLEAISSSGWTSSCHSASPHTATAPAPWAPSNIPESMEAQGGIRDQEKPWKNLTSQI